MEAERVKANAERTADEIVELRGCRLLSAYVQIARFWTLKWTTFPKE